MNPEEPPAVSGEQLRAWRDALGWTQDELALWLGVQGPAVSRWENNRNPVPGPVRRLVALTRAATA